MKKRDLVLFASLSAMLATATVIAQQAAQPPVAGKKTHTTRIHGLALQDDYFWLREKSNPEVIKYLEAENAYTEAVLGSTKPFQEALYNEMLGRIKQTDLSVPTKIGGYLYYSRTQEGKQYPYMCRRKGSMSGSEEILLDLNALAAGHKFLGLGAYVVSDDGNWLAYSTDTTGYRQYTLHVKDLQSGKTLAENIERVGSIVWATDNKTLFYTTEDPVSKRSDKFWRHTVGAAGSDLLHHEKDELFDVGAGRSLRSSGRLPRVLCQDVDRVPLPAGRDPDGGAESGAAARAGARARRRPLSRRLLHHHQSQREELPRRDRADGRSVGEELEAVHRSQSGDQDQRCQLLRQAHRRVRA